MTNNSTRILVVDDDPEIRELLAQYLSTQGLLVTAVANGAAMDSALLAHPYDLVVLDLMMPGEDGLSIARRLKRTTNVPIIMLTALGDSVDKVVGLEIGADDYLGKPFTPRVLLARIRAVLRRASAGEHAKSSDSGAILVVDDDEEIRTLLSAYLSKQGFQVKAVQDGLAMDQALLSQQFDLVLLDLKVPGEDGLQLATRVKQELDLPVIMMTAVGDEFEQVVGLELGADDYIDKPFEPRELLARVKAVLRRRSGETSILTSEGQYRFGDFSLDVHNVQLTKKDVGSVPLTSGEFDLLHVLVQHPYRVLDRDQILDLVSGDDRTRFDRSIDVRVTRLRSKIESDPSKPSLIRTIWGKGYMFCPEVT